MDELNQSPSMQMYRYLADLQRLLTAGFNQLWRNFSEGKHEPTVNEGGIMKMILDRNGILLNFELSKTSSNNDADRIARELVELLKSKGSFKALPDCYDKETIEVQFAFCHGILWISPRVAEFEQQWGYLDHK